MIRKTDPLGRLVLPAEYREALQIKQYDDMEISLDENRIILKKAVFRCAFCGSDTDLVQMDNSHVCEPCIERLKNLNRVGGYTLVEYPTSHTTVRTVRYTAVP